MFRTDGAMIFLPIILFIGLCEFSLVKSDKLPDNGRIEVGECLDKLFLRNRNWMRKVEDYLYSLCDKTRSELYHFTDRLEKEKEDPHEAYNKLQKCLDEKNHTDDLIKRYKTFAAEIIKERELKVDKFSEINQVVIGLCAEREWITYENLTNTDKPEAFHCLRDCAVTLFKNFEKLLVSIKTWYQIHLEQMRDENDDDPEKEKLPENQTEQHQSESELQTRDVSQNQDQSEKQGEEIHKDDAPVKKEHKHHVLQWLQKIKELLHIDNEHFEYKKGIENYEKTCEYSRVHEIKTLTDIGKLWARHYIDDIENEYNKYDFGSIKYDVKYAFNSYLHCSIWICAMGDRKDIPFLEYIVDTTDQMDIAAG